MKSKFGKLKHFFFLKPSLYLLSSLVLEASPFKEFAISPFCFGIFVVVFFLNLPIRMRELLLFHLGFCSTFSEPSQCLFVSLQGGKFSGMSEFRIAFNLLFTFLPWSSVALVNFILKAFSSTHPSFRALHVTSRHSRNYFF